MGLRMKNFNIMQVQRKIKFQEGVLHKNPIYMGELLRKGGLNSLQFSGRSLAKERGEGGGVFEGGWER